MPARNRFLEGAFAPVRCVPAHNRVLERAFAPVTAEVTAFDLPARIPLGCHGSWLADR